MQHPLAGKAIYLYLLIWSLIVIIHALLLHQLYGFTYMISFGDAFLFYILLAGFGFSLYYLVRYFRGTGPLVFGNVIAHLVAVAVLALLNTLLWREVTMRAMDIPSVELYVDSQTSWRMLSGAMLLVIILMFYYLMENIQRLQARETREKSLEALLRDTEMEMLRFQINPHFIFNSLNSISALTMENPQRAQEMVIRLSEFFRNALGSHREKSHALRQELHQIDLYLEIERVRFGDRLRLEREIDEECLDLQVPALILQPLYENAIKHGLNQQLEVTTIRTDVTCGDRGVNITITNPYDSMGSTAKGRGIGLKNVRARLELMYHIPDLVTIERKKDHFTVHLFIPVLKDDPDTAD